MRFIVSPRTFSFCTHLTRTLKNVSFLDGVFINRYIDDALIDFAIIVLVGSNKNFLYQVDSRIYITMSSSLYK